MNIYPTNKQCLQLLLEYKTPDHVIKHCTEVSRVSTLIACELCNYGHEINIDLVRSTAMLHDIARVHNNHEKIGAEYLLNLGYKDIADIVDKHMSYFEHKSLDKIDALDIVCIGDKIVLEDEYVGLDERMSVVRERAKNKISSERLKQFDERIVELGKFIEDIEDEIEISFDELLMRKNEEY